jgi:hypothetical protein
MKKVLAIALLLCGASLCVVEVPDVVQAPEVAAPEVARLSPELTKDWFDYHWRKMALASEDFEAMAKLAEDKKLQKNLEEIAEEFGELAKEFKKLKSPQGIMISLKNKEKWDALKKEAQVLKERKEKEIKAQKPEVEVVSAVVAD